MRIRWLSLVSAIVLVMALPGPAAAEPNVAVYHGTLTGGVLNDCDGVNVDVVTWGNWTATISPGLAQINGNEFHDFGDGAVHWTAFGGAAWGKWDVISAAPGSFHLSVLAFGSTQVDAYLADGQLQFHLEPYFPCASADVFGVVGTPGVRAQ